MQQSAVFDIRSLDIFKTPEGHYQFEDLGRRVDIARACCGRCAIFRGIERYVGTADYVGLGLLHRVEPVREKPGFYDAVFTERGLFRSAVPLKHGGIYIESELKRIPRSKHVGLRVGAFPIRALPFDDFSAITALAIIASATNAANANPDFPYSASDRLPVQKQLHHVGPGFADEPQLTVGQNESERLIQYRDTRAIVRDPAFPWNVCFAYGFRCVFSGLALRGPDGWYETEAAHLRPVSAGGPDTIQNGIALTATMHRLFDNYLITIDPEYRIRIVPYKPLRDQLDPLVIEGRRIYLPENRAFYPNPVYLAEHEAEFERRLLQEHRWPRHDSFP